MLFGAVVVVLAAAVLVIWIGLRASLPQLDGTRAAPLSASPGASRLPRCSARPSGPAGGINNASHTT